MNKILITDADSRNALSIIRSLKKRGHYIIAGSEKENSLSFYSKCIDEKLIYPSPYVNKSEFTQFMLDYIKNNEVDLVIPVSDLTIYPIVEKMNEFEKNAKIAAPKKNILDKAFDKEKTLKIADNIGIPIPKTYFINSISEINNISQKISYPLVIKPRLSRYWIDNKMTHGFRKFIYNKKDFVEKYLELHSQIPYPLIQEFVEGDGYGIFAIAKNGEVLTTFAHKRLKQVPPDGGASVLREAIKPDKKMEKYAVDLLKEMEWTGVAMVEFKGEKNSPKLMEVNGRFWGSIDLAVSSGVDFPYMLYQMYCEDKIDIPEDYNIGHKARWFRGEIEHVLQVLFGDFKKKPSKAKTIIDFFKFYRRNMSYDNLKLQDPLPGIIENGILIKRFIRRIFNWI